MAVTLGDASRAAVDVRVAVGVSVVSSTSVVRGVALGVAVRAGVSLGAPVAVGSGVSPGVRLGETATVATDAGVCSLLAGRVPNGVSGSASPSVTATCCCRPMSRPINTPKVSVPNPTSSVTNAVASTMISVSSACQFTSSRFSGISPCSRRPRVSVATSEYLGDFVGPSPTPYQRSVIIE